MKVILCVGETLEQRESGKTLEVIAEQLHAVKGSIKHEEYDHIVIAYEPVWAIGTGKLKYFCLLKFFKGKTASPEQAEDVHKYIREYLSKEMAAEIGDKTRIIYGGNTE